MSCRCDQPRAPAPLVISAGLDSIPRQIADFAAFRLRLLAAIPEFPALAAWRPQDDADVGIMLLEMAAYVFDVLAFYDETIAHEVYLRTARQRPALRKLVGLLGYRPRPAVAAAVRLAVLLEGRQPLVLPKGTAFRSGAFAGEPPQTFELDDDTRVHPLTNQWQIEAPPLPRPSSDRSTFMVERSGARLAVNDLVLLQGGGGVGVARRIGSLTPVDTPAGGRYLRVTVTTPSPSDGMPGGPLDNGPIVLSRPGQTAALWTGQGASAAASTTLTLNTLYRQLVPSADVIVTAGTGAAAFKVSAAAEVTQTIDAGSTKDSAGNTLPFKASLPLTQLTLSGSWPFGSVGAGGVTLHFGFAQVAREAVQSALTLGMTDVRRLVAPVEAPSDGTSPTRVVVADSDGAALEGAATLDFSTPALTKFDPGVAWDPLRLPVTVFGNVVDASRGETVAREVLASGDASLPSQTFKLQKKPLTYAEPAGGGAPVTSLRVWVSGVQWLEVPSFFDVKPGAHVYIVRADDEGQSFVTFGDGQRGARLPTGIGNVVASYRFGGGSASPPAGSISQIATPVPGLRAVKNPIAAAGGDDAESAAGLRQYAPRSALVLGRAVSIADMEAVAASAPGVRAVRAEWDWSPNMQRAAVLVRYIGDASLQATVRKQVRDMCDPSTPIDAVAAVPVKVVLSLQVDVDPPYLEVNVLPAVRVALAAPKVGMLSPERIGIGALLYRSRILAAVTAVEGVTAVSAMTWNGAAFSAFAQDPQAGRYFDLEDSGDLVLNGRGRHG